MPSPIDCRYLIAKRFLLDKIQYLGPRQSSTPLSVCHHDQLKRKIIKLNSDISHTSTSTRVISISLIRLLG